MVRQMILLLLIVCDTMSQRNKKEPIKMISSKLFGNDFDGSPKEKQVYYLSLIPSNTRCPLGVFEPANKKKSRIQINLAMLTTCNQSHEDLITGNDWLHNGVVSA